MKRIILLFSFTLFVQMSGTSYSAQEPSTESVVKLELMANGYCRGGSESKETDAWCWVRESLGDVLAARDWCRGKKDQDAIDYAWHKCEASSLKKPK